MTGLAVFEAELLKRHDQAGPRYTSYPSATQFAPSFDQAQLQRHIMQWICSPADRALSLYVHVPFCLSPCFYCGCNRVITRDLSAGDRYVDRLSREIELMTKILGRSHPVVQLHLGGGTPNFLSAQTLTRLIEHVGHHFSLSSSDSRDFSIELDPRSVPKDYAPTLARLGFNRVSLGVQDFDLEVQHAVNRVQSVDQTLQVLDCCRDHGIRSVNVDLIYGLPRQTVEGFRRTLLAVASARPDRLAVYGYAHLPGQFKAQRRIRTSDLPSPETRLDLLRTAIEELTSRGYRYIGMDHFALPDDELVRAQEAGTLQRNFMGYTTHAGCDLVGLGVSAISHIGDSFSQNYRELGAWHAAIDAGRLPLWRGLSLSTDDRLRGEVITQLMCEGFVDVAVIERRFAITFTNYFRDSLAKLTPHVRDGLLRLEPDRVTVTPTGRYLLRSIAMCFDAYLAESRPSVEERQFSKVV